MTPSPYAQSVLQTLQRVAEQTLARKRALGQCAVVWRDGEPVLIGEEDDTVPDLRAPVVAGDFAGGKGQG